MLNLNSILKICKFFLLIGLILIYPSICFSQGKVTRPKKQETIKTEKPSESSSSKLDQNQVTLNNLIETINGITVHWNSVTQSQKDAIMMLLHNMVFVQGGNFTTETVISNVELSEKSVQQKIISSFWISKYEITQDIWEEIMDYNPSYFKGLNLPVENISKHECQQFIIKINNLTGLKFKLPSAVEWEFVAKGGRFLKDHKYSGSDDIDQVAWFYKNSDRETKLVGSKKPNSLGIYDLSGNVWEWTSTNPSGLKFIVKGGSWSTREDYCEILNRNEYDISYKSNDVGFRLILTI